MLKQEAFKTNALEEERKLHEGHARRFIDINDLEKTLRAGGFFIEKIVQSRGFAPYGDEDPVIIRAVCRKGE